MAISRVLAEIVATLAERHGLDEKELWIAKATAEKHPPGPEGGTGEGGLHRRLHVAPGEKIPAKKMKRARAMAKHSPIIAREVALAQTLGKLREHRKR